MAHWNYRILFDGNTYGVAEVFYDNGGTIVGYSDPSNSPVAEWDSLDWLVNSIRQVQRAIDLPVVDVSGEHPLVWSEVRPTS